MSGRYAKGGSWLGTSFYEGHLEVFRNPEWRPRMDKDKAIDVLADDVEDLIKRVRELEADKLERMGGG